MKMDISHSARNRLIAAFCLLFSNPVMGEGSPLANHPPSTPSVWVAAAQKYGLQPLDLYAIALQESRRRRRDGLIRPWPWTLHSPETGALYFESYDAAAQKLTALIAKGTTNIDVGLMQINWGWNGYRVRDPRELLLPSKNISIAAEILREHLNACRGDRRVAIARYHNARKEQGLPYAASVLAIAGHLRNVASIRLALGN